MQVRTILLAIIPILDLCDGTNYWSACKNYLSSTDPRLPRTLVRQYEQTVWEIEPGKLTHSMNNLKLGDKVQVNNIGTKNRQLTSLTPSEMVSISAMAVNVIGAKTAKATKPRHKLGRYIYVSEKDINGYVVVTYKPLLLAEDVKPDLLRLIYHQLAQEEYETLAEFLRTVENIEAKSILFTGAAEAGLFATYQATMVIRRYPNIAEAGNFRNTRGQIQIITFNSPPPFTPETVQYFEIPPDNFLDFGTKDHEVAAEYSRWGLCTIGDSPHVGKTRVKCDENYLSEYFNEQKLSHLNIANLFSSAVTFSNSKILAQRLAKQRDTAKAGALIARASFPKISIDLARQDCFYCSDALQAKLQDVIVTKYREALQFVENRKLNGNWAANPIITCVRSNFNGRKANTAFMVTCYFSNSKGRHAFATYELTLEAKNTNADSGMDSQKTKKEDNSNVKTEQQDKPAKENEEDEDEEDEDEEDEEEEDDDDDENGDDSNNLKTQTMKGSRLKSSLPNFRQNRSVLINSNLGKSKGQYLQEFDVCLSDLFEAKPILKIFSPFHQENHFDLNFATWPYIKKTCNAKLVPDNALKLLYDDHRAEFLSLMTAPDMKNPETCQQSTSPPIVKDQGNSRNYWKELKESALHYKDPASFSIVQLITHLEVPDASEQTVFYQKILKMILGNIDNEPTRAQYDCTDPGVLWHSTELCPKICRVLVKSNFCERVQISKSGLKMSMRGESKVHEAVDTTAWDWKLMLQLKKHFEDRATLILKLCGQEKRHYYLAIFMEGDFYKEHKTIFS